MKVCQLLERWYSVVRWGAPSGRETVDVFRCECVFVRHLGWKGKGVEHAVVFRVPKREQSIHMRLPLKGSSERADAIVLCGQGAHAGVEISANCYVMRPGYAM
eukprot:6491546-Amphidinium_carterae.1